jgi:hypothetical protein
MQAAYNWPEGRFPFERTGPKYLNPLRWLHPKIGEIAWFNAAIAGLRVGKEPGFVIAAVRPSRRISLKLPLHQLILMPNSGAC